MCELSCKKAACKTSFVLLLMQRRRDRINEKMKALQELIPRCNKVTLHFSVCVCEIGHSSGCTHMNKFLAQKMGLSSH